MKATTAPPVRQQQAATSAPTGALSGGTAADTHPPLPIQSKGDIEASSRVSACVCAPAHVGARANAQLGNREFSSDINNLQLVGDRATKGSPCDDKPDGCAVPVDFVLPRSTTCPQSDQTAYRRLLRVQADVRTPVAVRDCGRRPLNIAAAGILYRGTEYARTEDATGRARVSQSGMAYCKRITCPTCRRRWQHEKAAEMVPLARAWGAEGGTLLHVVLTCRHDLGDDLDAMLLTLKAAARRLSDRNFKPRATKRNGVKHELPALIAELEGLTWVRVLQCTTGPSGFHPHFHCVFFVPPGVKLDPAKMQSKLSTAWVRAFDWLAKYRPQLPSAHHKPSRTQGVHVTLHGPSEQVGGEEAAGRLSWYVLGALELYSDTAKTAGEGAATSGLDPLCLIDDECTVGLWAWWARCMEGTHCVQWCGQVGARAAVAESIRRCPPPPGEGAPVKREVVILCAESQDWLAGVSDPAPHDAVVDGDLLTSPATGEVWQLPGGGAMVDPAGTWAQGPATIPRDYDGESAPLLAWLGVLKTGVPDALAWWQRHAPGHLQGGDHVWVEGGDGCAGYLSQLAEMTATREESTRVARLSHGVAERLRAAGGSLQLQRGGYHRARRVASTISEVCGGLDGGRGRAAYDLARSLPLAPCGRWIAPEVWAFVDDRETSTLKMRWSYRGRRVDLVAPPGGDPELRFYESYSNEAYGYGWREDADVLPDIKAPSLLHNRHMPPADESPEWWQWLTTPDRGEETTCPEW